MFENDATTAVWGLSPVFLVVGGVFHVCSLATPHWLANPDSYMGLWTYCQTSISPVKDKTDFVNPTVHHCVHVSSVFNSTRNEDNSWFRAVQGLEISATVFVLTSIVTGLMRINLGHRIWQIACGLCAIIAGIFGVAGGIVFGKNYSTIPDLGLSWAYMFNVVSSSLIFISGPMLVLDALINRS